MTKESLPQNNSAHARNSAHAPAFQRTSPRLTAGAIRSANRCSDPNCECHREGGKVHCPAHNDQNPSLSVNTGSTGKAIYHCLANCSQDTVYTALINQAHNGHRPTTALASPKAAKPKAPTKHDHFDWQSATIYDYTDENGTRLFQVGRIGQGDTKAIRQRRPDGRGGWIYKLEGVRRVLYRLPDILTADTVLIVEGEKACEAINRRLQKAGINGGIVATTNPHGAGKWREEYSQCLEGKEVLIYPDNDKPGHDHGSQVAAALGGIARRVKVVTLPDIAEKQGADDWLEAGHTVVELLSMERNATPKAATVEIYQKPLIDAVSKPPIFFTMYPYFPRRQVTLFSGHGGSGKSYLSLVFAAHLAAGMSWNEAEVNESGKVLFVSLEDEPNVVVWRMKQVIDAYYLAHKKEEIWRNWDIAYTPDIFEPLMRESAAGKGLDKTAAWDALAQKMQGYDTIIIDNASDAYIANINDNALVREFIRELQVLAQAGNSAVVLLAHIDKAGSRYGTGGDSYTGTTAWHNTVRSRLALVQEEGALLLKHEKANLSREAAPVYITRDGQNSGVPVVASVQEIANAKRDKAGSDAVACAPEVLRAILKAIKNGEKVTSNRGTGTNCFSFLKNHGLENMRKTVFYAAIDYLIDTGKIEISTYKNAGREEKQCFTIPEDSSQKSEKDRKEVENDS